MISPGGPNSLRHLVSAGGVAGFAGGFGFHVGGGHGQLPMQRTATTIRSGAKYRLSLAAVAVQVHPVAPVSFWEP